MTDQATPRDLDGEEQQLTEDDGWRFKVHRPMDVLPPDPTITKEYLAQAWRGSANPATGRDHVQGYGDTDDEARADVLDRLKRKFPNS